MVARTFISDQPDWLIPAEIWNGMNEHTSNNFEPALTAAENVNDTLGTADDLGGPITIGITQAELVKLREDFMVIKSFIDGIHYEVAELIDVPFTQKLEPVLQQSYDLNPESFRTEKDFFSIPRGESLQELISSVIVDETTKSKILAMIETLDGDEISQDLKDAIADARFWAEEFEKAEVISAIQQRFYEEHADEWDSLSKDERIELLEEYAIEIGRVLDEKQWYEFFRGNEILSDVRWHSENPESGSPTAFGYTYSARRDGIIYINDDFATGNPPKYDFSKVINTVTHETRHQYQNQVVHNTERFDTPSSIVSRLDRDNAINTGSPTYWEKPIEVDARGFAALCSFY